MIDHELTLCANTYMSLQFISVPDERYESIRRRPDFIKEYIFPGGCLPSLGHVMSAMTTSSRFRYVLFNHSIDA
jgi:cyclopropane fatty-acyl-phospholipid synthase-like methyltransferase